MIYKFLSEFKRINNEFISSYRYNLNKIFNDNIDNLLELYNRLPLVENKIKCKNETYLYKKKINKFSNIVLEKYEKDELQYSYIIIIYEKMYCKYVDIRQIYNDTSNSKIDKYKHNYKFLIDADEVLNYTDNNICDWVERPNFEYLENNFDKFNNENYIPFRALLTTEYDKNMEVSYSLEEFDKLLNLLINCSDEFKGIYPRLENIQNEYKDYYINATAIIAEKYYTDLKDTYELLKDKELTKDNKLECPVDSKVYCIDMDESKGIIFSNYNINEYLYLMLLYEKNNQKIVKVFKLYSDVSNHIENYVNGLYDFVKFADILLDYTDNIPNNKHVRRPNLDYIYNNLNKIIKNDTSILFKPIITNDSNCESVIDLHKSFQIQNVMESFADEEAKLKYGDEEDYDDE